MTPFPSSTTRKCDQSSCPLSRISAVASRGCSAATAPLGRGTEEIFEEEHLVWHPWFGTLASYPEC